MKNSLLIAGVERIDILEKNSLTIDRELTHVSDRCQFTLLGHQPTEGEEVIFTNEEAGILFGGIIVKCTLAKRSADQRVAAYDVDCDDYSVILDSKLVIETYRDMSASDIFLDIVEKYVTGFTVNGVRPDAPTIENTGTDLAYIRPSEAFRYLANYVGWEWEVTYTKDLRFFNAVDLHTQAPMELNPGGKFMLGKHSIDMTGLRNRVYVLGGTMLSDHQTLEWLADGVARQWVLPWSPHDNTLSIADELQSIGIEHIHNEENYDYMLNFTEKYIKASNHTPTPVNGVTIKLVAKQDIPVTTVFEDTKSQEALKAVQGGDGIYEHVLNDTSLVTIQAAEALGEADLKLHANPIVSGDFSTQIAGWFPGQIVRINMPHKGVDNEYMVQKVKIRRVDGAVNPDWVRWDYTVIYGGRLLGLADFLRQLVSVQQKDKGEETNIITRYIFGDERITTSDQMSTVLPTMPYKYGELRSIWGMVVLP